MMKDADFEFQYILNLLSALEYCSVSAEFEKIQQIILMNFTRLSGYDAAKMSYLKSLLPDLGEDFQHKNNNEYDKNYNKLIYDSAFGGVAEAQYKHGCHLFENGLFKDACNMYAMSSKQGHREALYCYGLELISGENVERCVFEGVNCIKMSAYRWYEPALKYLIDLYNTENEEFVSSVELKNYQKILMWL